MTDIEKVIKGLECHADRTNLSCNIIKCPYYELDFCGVILSQDALAVLKEHEAKTGKWIPIESPTGVKAFGVNEMTVMDVRCSVCGSEEDVSFTGYKYCPRCGTKMKGR